MTVEILVDHVYSSLVPPVDDHIVELADTVTSWSDPGAWHTPSYQNYRRKLRGQPFRGPIWDGRTHLLTTKRLRFPSGLVSRVQKVLWANGYDVFLKDERKYPESGCSIISLEGVELRDYQREAVRVGLADRCGVFSLPPGTGKTELMIALVRSLNVFPVLWLTHERVLLDQTWRRFCSRLADSSLIIGRAGEGVWEPGDITVATVQTMSRRVTGTNGKEFLQSMKVVVSDEVHHEPSGSWYKLLMRCPAPFRYGCSATPLMRPDGSDLKLIGSIGPVIYTLTPKEAVEKGVLSRPRIMFIKYNSPPEFERKLLSFPVWTLVYKEAIVYNSERNGAIVAACKRSVQEGRRVLILIRMLAHGRLLEKELARWFGTNQQVSFLQGSSVSVVRKEVVDLFRQGLVRVIIASSIFDEGIDIPEVDTVIIAAAGKSAIKSIQRIGRGMRVSDSAHGLEIYDFEDSLHHNLMKHTRERKRAYRSMDLCKVETITLEERFT